MIVPEEDKCEASQNDEIQSNSGRGEDDQWGACGIRALGPARPHKSSPPQTPSKKAKLEMICDDDDDVKKCSQDIRDDVGPISNASSQAKLVGNDDGTQVGSQNDDCDDDDDEEAAVEEGSSHQSQTPLKQVDDDDDDGPDPQKLSKLTPKSTGSSQAQGEGGGSSEDGGQGQGEGQEVSPSCRQGKG